MDKATYLARAGVTFLLPVHPGDAPVHQAQATCLQIAETIRLFNQHVEEHRLFENVQAQSLKQQILKAAEYRYLQLLEDPDFGFADISPREMLQHLKNTYGLVTPDDIEQNCSLLSAEWNPDGPIEDVWLRLRDCQGYATAAQEQSPIAPSFALPSPSSKRSASLLQLSTNVATSLLHNKHSTVSRPISTSKTRSTSGSSQHKLLDSMAPIRPISSHHPLVLRPQLPRLLSTAPQLPHPPSTSAISKCITVGHMV
jgi:hypothetical protein